MGLFDLFNRTAPQQHLLLELLEEQRKLNGRIDELLQHINHSSASTPKTSISNSLKVSKIVNDEQLHDILHISQFLAERGIQIKTRPLPQSYDSVHDEIACLIGNKYENIVPVLDHIKKSMQKSTPFRMNIATHSQQAIADMTLLCNKLHELAFLVHYYYQRSPSYVINARPSNASHVQNFFSGQWLERYATQVLLSTVNEHQLDPIECVTNAQITLANGDNFEFDIMFYHRERIYWVETKTGNYQEHIAKYSRFAEYLNLPMSQAIMLLPDAHESLTMNLSRLFQMHVVNLNGYRQHLEYELQRP